MSGRGLGLLAGLVLGLGTVGVMFTTMAPSGSPRGPQGVWVVAGSQTRLAYAADYHCAGDDDDVVIDGALADAGAAVATSNTPQTVLLLDSEYFVEAGEIVVEDPRVHLIGESPAVVITWNKGGVTDGDTLAMIEYTWSDGLGQPGKSVMANITLDGSIHDHTETHGSLTGNTEHDDQSSDYTYEPGTLTVTTAGYTKLTRGSDPATGQYCEVDDGTFDLYTLAGHTEVALKYDAAGKETTQDLLVIDHMTESPNGFAEMVIENVYVKNAPDNGIDVQDGEIVRFQNVYVSECRNNTGDFGIGLDVGGATMIGVEVDKCDIGLKSVGTGTAHTVINGFKFMSCTGYGMDFGTTGGAHAWTNISAIASQTNGLGIIMPYDATLTGLRLDFSGGVSSVGIQAASRNVLSSMWIENVAQAILIASDTQVAVVNSIFKSCGDGAGYQVIDVTDAGTDPTELIFSGNTFLSCAHDILLLADPGIYNVTISNNQFQGSAGATRYGILSYASDVSVTGNVFDACGTDTGNLRDQAMFSGTAIAISGNVFTGSSGRHGLHLYRCEYASVVGNLFNNSSVGGGGSAQLYFDTNAGAVSDECVVSGNIFIASGTDEDIESDAAHTVYGAGNLYSVGINNITVTNTGAVDYTP